MFRYLRNYEEKKFLNYKPSYGEYWLNFIETNLKANIWWDRPFKVRSFRFGSGLKDVEEYANELVPSFASLQINKLTT